MDHGNIENIFPNVFFVMGANKTTYAVLELQHSRNMVIVREGNKLTLINTVKLNDKGLEALDALGQVENIVRIGSFHGRDDAFYKQRYQAKLWELKGMSHEDGGTPDKILTADGEMPFPDCSLFIFETSKYPECILHIAREGGILITCDSIKNWISADRFFSDETAKLYEQQGFFGAASITQVWKQACNITTSDFEKLKSYSFRHLLSAHGEPLLNSAYAQVLKSLNK